MHPWYLSCSIEKKYQEEVPMINETGNTENTNFSDEAGRTPFGQESVKTLGKKSLEPLVSVLGKHKSDFSPYLDALTKALKSGAEALQKEDAGEAEKFIGRYFSDGLEFIGKWKDKLSSQSPDDVMKFLEEEGKKHPAVLFGASYFAGMILGRVGRHLGKTFH